MKVLSSRSSGGALARRLVPIAILAPILLGWLRLFGQERGYYDTAFGLAIFATSNIVCFVALVWWNAQRLSSSDAARIEAEAAAREAGLSLAHLHDMEASEAKFRALLEAAPDAMVIANARGEIALVNSQAERLFGFSRSELLGRPAQMLIPERFREGSVARIQSYHSNPGTTAWGSRIPVCSGLRKDGSEFPMDFSRGPIQTSEGMLISSTIRDVTERHKAEEQRLAPWQPWWHSSDDAIIGKNLEGIITELERGRPSDVWVPRPEEVLAH